jgi:glycine/D-amino acid oxidase-like deaminating enzyme
MVKVVICGGGIMGCGTAYYLSRLLGSEKADITVVEACDDVASQASGKAGGFLARDWCSGPLASLAERSFDMHEQLAQELGAEVIGYRRLSTLAVTAERRSGTNVRDHGVKSDGGQCWLDDGVVKQVSSLGSTETTAQVHPRLLTRALMDKSGASLVKGRVEGVSLDGKKVQAVMVEGGRQLEADVVVVTMGPWSGAAASWFPDAKLPVIRGSRAHSVVLAGETPPTAVFLQLDNSEPELYPRPDGTVYVCGAGDAEPLPADPREVTPRMTACDQLVADAGAISHTLRNAEVRAKQACYLPAAPDGQPVIGAIPGYEGAFVAAGHTCWGILNGPATCLAMAEMILGRPVTVPVAAFDPARFSPERRRR